MQGFIPFCSYPNAILRFAALACPAFTTGDMHTTTACHCPADDAWLNNGESSFVAFELSGIVLDCCFADVLLHRFAGAPGLDR